jgi:Cd2+/Zn2+-exporting ATPase
MENLDCANCAAKIEAKFNALPEVEQATIVFATRQLRLTAADPDGLLETLTAVARTVEGEVEIHPRERHAHHHHEHCDCGGDHGHHHHDHCDCGHHHEEAHHHDHDHGESLMPLLLGGGLFVGGLVLGHFGLTFAAGAAYIAAYLVLGLEILGTAWKNLLKGHVFDENFLMSIATIGAFLIGEFPEAVGVMLFYRVGEYFEHKAVERSRSQIMEAVDLRPETVNLLHGDHVETIPAEDAKIGDILLVRPGDRIPLDGMVVSGESRIDTAPITGEPVPVRVGVGDSVTSGCVNTAGKLTIRVEKELSQSMVTRILNSVENAAASKPKIDRFITRFARVYTPIVVALAALTAVLPSLITGDWGYWVYTALSFLVMSCPCALVLSVPLAFFSGIGVGSKQGILFKGGASIEAMADVKAVALDKTGTVTKGDFSVQEVLGGEEILALCAACEQYSTHPIAVSILSAAKERNLEIVAPEKVEELSGRGIRAEKDGKTVLCGNRKLLEENGISADDESGTVVYVAVDGTLAGWIRIADTLKDGATEAVRRLKEMGVTAAMLTGDSGHSANAVAAATGISKVYAKLLPHEKLEVLQKIRGELGSTMFVGDGINDAPVLAGADVGAAMGSGADAAIEAADVVYMTSDIRAVPQSVSIARQTKAIAWQNVVFALAVKAVVMALGLAGCASMWMAVFADSGVAMLCVLNSIRLLYRKH